MSRNSIVQRKDIKVGKIVYIVDYNDVTKVQITKYQRSRNGGFITGYVLESDNPSRINNGYWGSLSDRGVIKPYDNRPAQMFTNKRAALFFAEHFSKYGINPNFFIKNPHNNQVIDIVTWIRN